MSFFYDFLKYFDLTNIDAKTTITNILGYGVIIIGNLKIKDIQEDEIVLNNKREIISIFGKNLIIKSISKGEIIISGNVTKIETGDL